MNNDIRNLSKWLNEDQETPIDRQALARVLAMAEQPAQGCDYCNHPQYAGTKCKNCGREQPAQQEPVALPCCGYTDASAVKWNPYNQVLQCHNCGQVYTSPPAQRKPLTDEQAMALTRGALNRLDVVRKTEAAHGITKCGAQ